MKSLLRVFRGTGINPGLGRLLVDALQTRDYPMVSGVNLFFATGVVLLNLLIDLIYPYLTRG